MRKITFLFLTTCLILTNLTVGYTQDADLDTLRASDVNADGVINILDLTLVAASIGTTPAADQPLNPDVNGDGTVNILDLTRVASHLGKTVPPPVAFVDANPAIGRQIPANATIIVIFDMSPDNVTVNAGVATTVDKTVTITGPFPPGPFDLTIAWTGGSQTLTYTVDIPDIVAPEVTGGTISDGDKDLDAETVNTNGRIEVEFSEAVSGNIALQTAAGEDAGWIGKVEGKKGTLELVKGREIGNETTYVIAGQVSDAVGNSTDIRITFTLRPPAAFVSAHPASPSQIAVDDTITVTFDNPPEDVRTSTGDATTTGKTVKITGPFKPGPLVLTIVWADGIQTLNYTAHVPDTEAPKITSSSVNNGDKDVDPEALNLPGRIEVTFNETVTGNIALQTAAGADAGWLGKIAGKKGTLELVRGKELGNEITYVIAGKVSDAAGNSTDLNIRFTTSSKTSGIPFEVTDATFNSLVLNSEVPVLLEYVKDG